MAWGRGGLSSRAGLRDSALLAEATDETRSSQTAKREDGVAEGAVSWSGICSEGVTLAVMGDVGWAGERFELGDEFGGFRTTQSGRYKEVKKGWKSVCPNSSSPGVS